MTEYYEIVKSFLGKNNWINTVVLIVMAFSFNSKLNKLLIQDGISETKITVLERDLADYKKAYNTCNGSIAVLKYNLQSHIGEAYIREEDID